MKLVLRMDAPDDGEEQPAGPSPDGEIPSRADEAARNLDWKSFEPVLERELLELYPDAARYDLAEISVSLMTADGIRRLNKDYRDCDEATDVLSFPMCEEDGRFVPDVDVPVLSLGDVVICPEETARLHPELPEKEAVCLMLAHSFLHLLAWDHDTDERRDAMWARQDELKARLMASCLSASGETARPCAAGGTKASCLSEAL